MISPKAELLFEVSWEVCNKVGGIYTVVMSKAHESMAYYNGNYYLIGPYFHDKAVGEFEEEVFPDELKDAFEELRKIGISCRFGEWLIKGQPHVILIDFSGFYYKLNEIKTNLWNDYRIDSLNTGADFNDPVLFSYAAGTVIQKIVEKTNKKAVAQFHEWMVGAGLLYLKKNNVKCGTVFTTHATILGRAIAGSNIDLYSGIMDKIDSGKEAYTYGIPAKYQVEKQCALNADVFTTVSEITGMEAEKLLKRKPDVLLPNGLDVDAFPSFEECSIKHKQFKFRMKEFVLYYFFPYYSFDLDETYLFFIFGRYEFQNKGIDVFIKALSKLNKKLQDEGSGRTIVAFFFIPADIKGIKMELVENKRYYEDVKESVDNSIETIRANAIYGLISRKKLEKETLFSADFLTEVKKKMMRFSRAKKIPPLVTHDLHDENSDAIINYFRKYGLDNSEGSKVKVVFYPTYLSGADGLLDLAYYETIMGSHLGVFPSTYEPWGYTPLETSMLGVASITTDSAGFGRYIYPECRANISDNPGIFVIKRFGKKEEDTTNELADVLHYYSTISKDAKV